MSEARFSQLVSLACHDLRTPLATVYGFARTLRRDDELGERQLKFVSMMEEASEQMAGMLDDLATASRIEAGRWEPALRECNTLELVAGGRGEGATIETEVDGVKRGLEALATAAMRYGPTESVAWDVRGRELVLSPVLPAAGPVVVGEEPRDLGSLVARLVIEALGGSLALDGETLTVRL
ncbi:MAG TPA: histidine kinase dimerization/phospho-acceptor domain-containing protein [Gaiellaceae bacterium]|nr:histidine kinase dimerization/phospho-acceptor domain-containing protein [Gaiellaceae bacterium]